MPRHQPPRLFGLLFCLALIAGCGAAEAPFPWLAELDAGAGARASGERLMALPFGLHGLEPQQPGARVILVGVHGYASQGYEWIYPLKTVDDEQTATYFFRWDFEGCPGPAADTLREALRVVLSESTGVEQIRILGHSFGGALVASLLGDWDLPVPAEIHAVAAPLAGSQRLENRCGYRTPAHIAEGITFSQWRTIQALDNAFKDQPVDPQVIELPGSEVMRLPETYRGQRLGHNWSISWVADALKARSAAGSAAPAIGHPKAAGASVEDG